MAGKIKALILALYGGKDRGIPLETVRNMEAKMKAAGNDKVKVVIYPNAPHAFHADYRPNYREVAAKYGWKCLSEFLKKHGAA